MNCAEKFIRANNLLQFIHQVTIEFKFILTLKLQYMDLFFQDINLEFQDINLLYQVVFLLFFS